MVSLATYTAFTIDGEKVNCFTVLMTTRPFEKEGDSFFEYMTTGLVPIDQPETLYTMDDASDFWEVFGRNTDDVIDPEECMAENFPAQTETIGKNRCFSAGVTLY